MLKGFKFLSDILQFVFEYFSVTYDLLLCFLQEPCNPAAVGSGVQIENLLSNQTNPMSGATESGEGHECYSTNTDQHETSELDGDSSKQENRTIDGERLNLEEEGSSNMQVAEDVRRSTEESTSGDVTMATEQQSQAYEEVTEVTSPKSVLPVNLL